MKCVVAPPTPRLEPYPSRSESWHPVSRLPCGGPICQPTRMLIRQRVAVLAVSTVLTMLLGACGGQARAARQSPPAAAQPTSSVATVVARAPAAAPPATSDEPAQAEAPPPAPPPTTTVAPTKSNYDWLVIACGSSSAVKATAYRPGQEPPPSPPKPGVATGQGAGRLDLPPAPPLAPDGGSPAPAADGQTSSQLAAQARAGFRACYSRALSRQPELEARTVWDASATCTRVECRGDKELCATLATCLQAKAVSAIAPQ